jgi:hypothetical protein
MEDDHKIQIRYRNSPAYRSIHASGAYGGVIPTGDITLGIFSERNHFPESAIVAVSPETKQGTETVQVEKGIVREMEVGIIMNLSVAKAIRQWLDDKIAFIEANTDPNKRIEIAGAREKTV